MYVGIGMGLTSWAGAGTHTRLPGKPKTMFVPCAAFICSVRCIANHQMEQEMSNEIQGNTATVSLWNPNAAAWWSILFSPIFGAWLQAKNWSVLGDEGKAKQSMYWVYGGIAVGILSILVPIIGLVYLICWWFFSARKQVKHVENNLNSAYVKKGWAKPIGIAVGSFFALLVIIGISAAIVIPAYSDYKIRQADASGVFKDFSGVWRATKDGAMVTLKLDGKMKSIDINGKEGPVRIKGYDNENKIVTLAVNNDPSLTWTLRKIFDNDGKFTLSFTLHDGTQDDLHFVRNL